MILELDLIPLPADSALLMEDTQYLVLASDDKFHTATWDGEQFILDNSEEAEDDDEIADEDRLEVVMLASLPDLAAPSAI